MKSTDKTAIVLLIATALFGFVGKLYIDRSDMRACLDRDNSQSYCMKRIAN